MPLVAILWGWADGETILAVHLLGFLSILLGIGLLNYEKEK
jgi:hypothetical protein